MTSRTARTAVAEHSCGSCRFASIELDGDMRMECHRYPPVYINDPEWGDGIAVGWPQVSAEHWCGEWQPQEARRGE